MTNITQTPEGLAIEYTGRSFNDLRTDFFKLSDIQLPTWTDRNNYDPGVVLANYSARIGAMLNFYTDRRAEEHFPKTARLLSSLRRMGEFDGYAPSPPTTASVPVTLVTTSAGTIPKLFTVSSTQTPTDPAIQYELLEEYTVPSAGSYVLTFYHGVTRENMPLGTSDGSPFQTFTVRDRSVATTAGYPDVQVEVYTGSSWVSWERVDKLFNAESTDEVFQVYYDDRTNAVVKFGDGVTGKIPASGSNLRVTYRVGGGVSGSRPGRLSISNISNARGCTIVSSVVNLSAPTGGRDAETLEEAKVNLSKARAARDNLVRFSDIESSVKQAGLGVSRIKVAKAYNPYKLDIIISSGGTNPSPTGYWDSTAKIGSGLIGSVGSYIAERVSESYVLSISPAISVPIISEVVVKCQPWAYKREVEKRVKLAITDFLNSDNQDFNGSVKLNEFAKLLEDLDGVDYSEITEFHRLPRAKFYSGLDAVTFSNYAVGSSVNDEIWSIIFIDAERYKVLGSKSGEQKKLGTANGTQFVTDNGSLAFSASILDVSPRAGTIYKIKTSKYVGTVTAEEDEILVQGTTYLTVTGGKH